VLPAWPLRYQILYCYNYVKPVMTRHILLILLSLFALGCSERDNVTAQVASNGIPLQRNSHDFSFVVVGDRTGGHRPQVFSNAMRHINLLNPDFVVSVGDLIEGYSQDEKAVNQ